MPAPGSKPAAPTKVVPVSKQTTAGNVKGNVTASEQTVASNVTASEQTMAGNVKDNETASEQTVASNVTQASRRWRAT